VDLGDVMLVWCGEGWMGPPWDCRYCQYRCPGGGRQSILLAKITKARGLELTSHGKRHEDALWDHIRGASC